MKKAAVTSLIVSAAFFFAVPVFADTVFAQQPQKGALYQTGGGWSINIGTGLTGTTTAIVLSIENLVSAQTTSVRFACYTDSAYSVSCPGFPVTTNSHSIPVQSQEDEIFPFSSDIALDPTKYYQVRQDTNFGNIRYYGDSFNSFSGSQIFYQVIGTPFEDWTGINATSTALTSLYQSGASSTLDSIRVRCTGTGGGIFGEALCATIAFLFVPDPAIISGYAALTTTAQGKFPISYISGVSNAFSLLSASTTQNLAAVSIAFSTVDPATSTPFGALLPNLVVLSTSTISRYIPSNVWNALQFLIAAGLWLALAGEIFFYVRNKMHRV